MPFSELWRGSAKAEPRKSNPCEGQEAAELGKTSPAPPLHIPSWYTKSLERLAVHDTRSVLSELRASYPHVLMKVKVFNGNENAQGNKREVV